jgi:superfamily II DNA helicase RecQ
VKFVKQKDLPRNLYDLVQELGRANRLLRDMNCSFGVHLDYNSSTRLFLSCMSNEDPSEREITWDMALQVLGCLVTPTVCYHYFIEKYFHPTSNPHTTCGNCSFCTGDTASFTGLLLKDELQSFLTTTFLTGADVLATDLLTKIRTAKSDLFHRDHVPGDMDAAPIHALGLQLIASRILVFHLNDNSKASTKKLSEKNASVKLGIKKNDRGREMPAFMLDASWVGFTLSESDVE